MSGLFSYPVARRDEALVEEIHGHKVSDPYRWLEDPDSEETKAFVTQQNSLSLPYIKSCSEMEKIRERLTKMWNFPKYGLPRKEGDKYFFVKNSGLQNQFVWYMQDDLDSEPKVFFDPNTLSSDGTISVCDSAFSEDGSTFAYGLSYSGSDWFDIHFKDVKTGEDYPEVLKKAKFCDLEWTHDNKGIFYACYSEFDTDVTGRDTTEQSNQKLFYHRLGTSQSEDILCVEFPDHPKWRISSTITDCGRYLIICPGQDCRDNLVFFTDLAQLPDGQITGKLPLTQVVFQLEADYCYVANFGSKVVFHTNKNAPNYQLAFFDFDSIPSNQEWVMTTLVPQHEKNVLRWATCSNHSKLILCYMEDVKDTLEVRDIETGNFLYKIPVPIGGISSAHAKAKTFDFFYKFSSMICPGVVYYVDMREPTPNPIVFRRTVIEGLDLSLFELNQVFYPSKDGTMVPMFIASRKDIVKRNNTTPCLLYGYGGFNISLTPDFSIEKLFFANHFGYACIANLRGGGEYGEAWHNAGRLFNKQNVFDDFHSAAEYLVREGYTCKEKLVIRGGSNGGLLVTACLNQRPDLYGAGVAQVPVTDMLRFHKFTIGYAWCSDYGNPDLKEYFDHNLSISPLHNIKPPESEVQYPSTLVTSGDHDDRVVPSHTLKFIAELQHVVGKLPNQKNPLMTRIDTKAGHGAGKPTTKVIEELVEYYSFVVKSLEYDFKE